MESMVVSIRRLVHDAINFIVPPKDRKQIRLEEKKKVHLQKLIEKRKKVF